MQFRGIAVAVIGSLAVDLSAAALALTAIVRRR